jgi:hypothetical protein
VKRCLERAAELGVVAALDDRARSGRDPGITAESRAWLVALACAKPTQLLDDGNDRAILVQGDEGSAQVVRLGHRGTSIG